MAIQRMRSRASSGWRAGAARPSEGVEVDVGLEEAVEQAHAVGADGLQALDEMGQRREEGGSFMTTGTLTVRLSSASSAT
jgi:hypothetical protein